jgi:hypothetical protein
MADKNNPSFKLPVTKNKLGDFPKISRSGRNLDELFGYTPSDVENTKNVSVVADYHFDEVFEEYEEFLELNFSDLLDNPVSSVLRKSAINPFVQLVQEKYSGSKCFSTSTGYFVGQLIANSYKHGENDFFLNLENISPLSCIGPGMKGKKKNPLRLDVLGNVGLFFGDYSVNLIANIMGDVGYSFGHSSNNFIATIIGNASSSLGSSSNNMAVAVTGTAGNDFGSFSDNLTAYVGDVIYGFSDFYDGHNFLEGIEAKVHPKYVEMIRNSKRRFEQ